MHSSNTAPSERQRRLDWTQVRTLYARELRAALREKSIIVNSILIPIFLYPFLLWIAFSAMMFVMGQSEGITAQVIVKNWPPGHSALRKELHREKQFQLLPAPASEKQALFNVREGLVDAYVEFLPAKGSAARLSNNFEARITWNQTRESSGSAKARLEELIRQYRASWLESEARQRGIDAAQWEGFSVSSENIASGRQIGFFLLSMLVPVIFVVMVAVGCFYPAVDSLAGERERHTWETLMSTAATRLSIVTAKYLYVVTLGGFAGLVNLAAILLTAKPVFAPLLEKAGKAIEFTIAPGAIPVAVLAAVLLAGFIAAGMMLFAAFARTFKEGQAMITPFYLVILIPVVMLQAPGSKLTIPIAFVPIANVAMMVREAVSGTLPLLPAAITIGVSLILIMAFLRLATYILQFEDVMVGSYNGSLLKLIRERWLRSRKGRLQPQAK